MSWVLARWNTRHQGSDGLVSIAFRIKALAREAQSLGERFS